MTPCAAIHIPLDGFINHHPKNRKNQTMKNKNFGMLGAAMVAMAASIASPLTAPAQASQTTQTQKAVPTKRQAKVAPNRRRKLRDAQKELEQLGFHGVADHVRFCANDVAVKSERLDGMSSAINFVDGRFVPAGGGHE